MKFTKITPLNFNIGYGNSAPADITKLWVKTAAPNSVEVSYSTETPFATMTKDSSSSITNCCEYPSVYVNKKLYLFGGKASNGANTIKYYDTETKTVTTLSVEFPLRISRCAVGLVGTKVYIFGGAEYTSSKAQPYDTIMCFDIELETLITVDTVLPRPMFGIAAGVVGTKIYLFGGKNDINGVPTQFFSDIYCFDSENLSLTKMGELPSPTAILSPCVVDTKIYLFNGRIGSGTKYNVCYDTVTNGVNIIANSPSIQDNAPAWYYDGYIHLFQHNNTDYIMYKYCIATDEYKASIWENTNKVFDWQFLYAEDNKAYLLAPSYECEYVVPPCSVEPNSLLILTSDNKSRFKILDIDGVQIETSIRAVYKGNEDGIGEQVEAFLFNRNTGEWVTI